MYAKVFSGATVGLWMRRGRARMEGARQTEKVRERESQREKREGWIPHLASCHKLLLVAQLHEQEHP